MYKIGTYVVYRQGKVCFVEAIETPSFESDQLKKYYKLKYVFEDKNDTTIYVPVDAAESLRLTVTQEQAQRALDEASRIRVGIYTTKRPPQLVAHYQELLGSSDISKSLSLLKEISMKERTANKKLSEVDVHFRQRTEKLVLEELAVAFGETTEQARKRLAKKLSVT